MTAQVEGLGRRAPDQLKLRLHSHLHDVFGLLCNDPKTTIIILSGSERSVLDEVAELLSCCSIILWISQKNGLFAEFSTVINYFLEESIFIFSLSASEFIE